MVTYNCVLHQPTKSDKGSRKMEIGVSTACFYPMETENTPEVLKNIGVTKAEVFLNSCSEYEEEFCRMLRDKFDENGIEIVSVHAFVAMHEPFLFESYKRRREDALSFYKKVVHASNVLGAKFHTFHGARHEFFKGREPDYKMIGESISELSDIAGEEGVKLAWENVSWCLSNSPEFIKNVLPYITSENFGFTLDLKQALRADFKYVEFLEIFKEKLLNVHISDRNEFSDCKLPGDGNRDFEEVVRSLKGAGYDGDLIIEVYNNAFKDVSDVKKSVEYMRNILKNC